MFIFLLLLFNVYACHSVSVKMLSHNNDIDDIRDVTDLDQVLISCQLNDLIIIDVPIIEGRDTAYILYRPNGHSTKLNITIPLQNYTFDLDNEINIEQDEARTYEKVRFVQKPVELKADRKYEVFNLHEDNSTKDVFGEKQRLMKANEFIIGPLDESDHGNWLLRSVYNDGGHTMAADQVIVIEIIETVPANEMKASLRVGDTFMPQFAFPIQDIQTCELVVPKAAVDKAYDRNRRAIKSCGYIIRNVTREDSGIWQVLGVGRIVYLAKIWLLVT